MTSRRQRFITYFVTVFVVSLVLFWCISVAPAATFLGDERIRIPPCRGGSLTRWASSVKGCYTPRAAPSPVSERFARVRAGGRNAINSSRTTASGVPLRRFR